MIEQQQQKIDKLDYIKIENIVHQRILPRKWKDNLQNVRDIYKSCI